MRAFFRGSWNISSSSRRSSIKNAISRPENHKQSPEHDAGVLGIERERERAVAKREGSVEMGRVQMHVREIHAMQTESAPKTVKGDVTKTRNVLGTHQP